MADTQYGGRPTEAIDDYLLHACEVTWIDPGSGEVTTARVDAPPAWDGPLSTLGAVSADP